MAVVYVKRKEHESTSALLRRFTRRVQTAGILLRARETRFYRPKSTKRERRERALRRQARLAERERLLKLGELKEEPRR